ncbi:MAG: aldo/keto reductase [Candidatus Riflebacteria bacterium]|nr:aldo/keto reductase [Candidatus Riflebacteria bacterium]
MRYKLFGRTGLRVSELALGTMTFGENWGIGANRDESRRVFERYVEEGGNFFDTANRYTDGTSERFLGEFIRGERERYVIATKFTLSTRPGDPNACGNHRKNLVQSLERSLERLGTDYVDLMWVHAWDETTPLDELMRALDDAVRAGKVLYVGISDAPAWVVARANTLAELRGWTSFGGLQIEYSLVQRTPERELLPMAAALDLAVTPWGPLGGGVLTGKYRDGRPQGTRLAGGPWGDAYVTPRNLAIAAAVSRVADRLERTPSQVALAWVRQQPANVMIPILGARTLPQLEENLSCLAFTIPQEQLAELDAVSAVDKGFPGDFLAWETIREMVHGDAPSRVDDHHRRAR